MDKIFEAMEVPETVVRENAIQFLVEMVKYQYEYLEFYLQKIAIAINNILNNDEEVVGV